MPDVKRKLMTADGKTILPYTTNIPVVPGGGILMTAAGLAVDRNAITISGGSTGTSGGMFVIGGVQTLSAGAEAYVVATVSGAATVLTFGIPRGADGNDGADGANGSDPTKIMLTVPEDVSGNWYLNVKLSKADGSVDIEAQSGLYGDIHVFNGSTWEDVDYVTQYHAGMPAVIDLNAFFVHQPLDFSVYKSSANDGVVTYYWSDANEQLTDAQSVILGVCPGTVNPSGMAAGNIANIAVGALQLSEMIDSSATAVNISELYGGVLYEYANPVSSVVVSSCTYNSIGDIIHFTAANNSVTVDLPGGLIEMYADPITSGATYDLMVCNNRVAIKQLSAWTDIQ